MEDRREARFRQRQARGLMLLALLAIAVCALRWGNVFLPGWWRLW